MKVCFFNTNRQWGGGEKWHFEMARALSRKRYDVLMITHQGSPLFHKALKDKIMVHPLPVSNLSFLNPFKVLRLKRFFLANQVNTLILNLPSDMKIAAPAAKMAGVKKIIYRRGSAIPVKNTFLNRYYFRNLLTCVIANSLETKRTLLQNNPGLIDENKIKVIYNGIHLERYDKHENGASAKKISDPVILGNAGRLTSQKGHKDLIDCTRMLIDRGHRVELRIAGDGPLRERLRNYAREKKVQDHIQFLGFVDDMVDFLHSLDIFLLSSRWEGFGYVIAEAMACNKPVIAYNISSSPELIIDNETGFLVAPFDIAEFANKTEQLINNPERSGKMGKKGRQRIESAFKFDHSFKQFKEYIFDE